MSNDTSTLNGSLMELGETIAYNLLNKGIESKAEEGLTTLANKILNIPSMYNLILYDNAVIGDLNNNAFSYNNVLTVTTDTEGTLVSNNSGAGRVYSAIFPTLSYTDWESPFKVEMDIVSGDGSVRVQILKDSSNYITQTLSDLGNPTHITLEYDGETANYYVNNNSVPIYTETKSLSNPLQIRFYLPNNTSFKYKNYRIYRKTCSIIPIEENSITLSIDKSILSLDNSESAILTATLADSNNSAVSGATITFYQGTTSLGTATTDSNGEATKTYISTGTGDISFTAVYREAVSNVVTIEDCKYYDATEITLSRGSYSTLSPIAQNVAGNQDDWILEFDAKGVAKGGCLNIGASTKYTPNSDTANYRMGIGFDYVSSRLTYYANVRSSSSNATSTGSPSANTYYHFKMVKTGTSIAFYIEDSLYATKTVTWIGNYNQYDLYPNIWSGSTTKFSYKNLKFKLQ